MTTIALIPARYHASRFPGKMMALIGGTPVIRMTYEATVATGLFDDVFVVTDSDIIFREITDHGGKAIKSIKEHECGSDRIAEAAERMDADIIVNVQGDEPFTQKAPLQQLLAVFEGPDADSIDVASLMQPLNEEAQIQDPNFVKVVTDLQHFALYFSRSAIPYRRNKEAPVECYEHIGIYAFKRQALLDFYHAPSTPLENAEKIECIRYLEMGKRIKMVVTDYMGVEIDTPNDLARANELLAKNGL